MKFRDYFAFPENLLMIPAGTLDRIEVAACHRGGVASFYISLPLQYYNPKIKQHRYMTVWQLIDYNINTDSINRLHPYRKVITKGEIPEPDSSLLPNDLVYFTNADLPPSVRKMLRDKVKYYKTTARKK